MTFHVLRGIGDWSTAIHGRIWTLVPSTETVACCPEMPFSGGWPDTITHASRLLLATRL